MSPNAGADLIWPAIVLFGNWREQGRDRDVQLERLRSSKRPGRLCLSLWHAILSFGLNKQRIN